MDLITHESFSFFLKMKSKFKRHQAQIRWKLLYSKYVYTLYELFSLIFPLTCLPVMPVVFSSSNLFRPSQSEWKSRHIEVVNELRYGCLVRIEQWLLNRWMSQETMLVDVLFVLGTYDKIQIHIYWYIYTNTY